jgi:energy-coupling factor transporter transmembrane protein EcfT
MRIDSPLARLHIATKVLGVLLLSLILVHQMDMHDTDPAGAVALAALSLVALLMSGALAWLFRSYLFVIFPMLSMLFITWLIFNPDRGTQVYFERPLYDGTLTLAISGSLVALVLVPAITYRLARSFFWGLVGGLALALLLSGLKLNPRLVLAEVPFFQPISLIISDRNLVVAVTKVFGYATMVFLSLTLVMTTRDAETLGLMQQLRLPYSVSFFTSVMLRSLSMAVLDYGTIRQAQVARGVDVKRKGLLGRILDLARVSVPLIVTMIRRSTEVGDAVMARGMTRLSTRPVEFHETRPIRPVDLALMVLFVALAAAVLVFRFNLSRWVGLGAAGAL